MINRLSNPGELYGRGLEDEVVEVALLLPGWQAAALEEAAHARGLTAAAMVRRLLREFLEQEAAIRPLGE